MEVGPGTTVVVGILVALVVVPGALEVVVGPEVAELLVVTVVVLGGQLGGVGNPGFCPTTPSAKIKERV